MKPKELAEILGIKPESLRTKINRAIKKGEIDALELKKGWSFSMKEDLPEYIVNWVNAQFIPYDKERLDELRKLASSDLKHGLNEAKKHIEKELGETYSIRKRQKKSISLRKRLSSDVLVISVLALINYLTNGFSYMWFLWAAFGWGIGLVFHAIKAFQLSPFMNKDWEERKIKEYMDSDTF